MLLINKKDMPDSKIISRLEILNISDKTRSIVFEAPYHFETPN